MAESQEVCFNAKKENMIEQKELNKIDPSELEVGAQVRSGYAITGFEDETLTLTLRRIEQNEDGDLLYAFGAGSSKQDYTATFEEVSKGTVGVVFTLREIIRPDDFKSFQISGEDEEWIRLTSRNFKS